ncbi:MAG: winged helix-turn-helix transcriptional regulator [Candidatus Bathyarchaeota archaeon]|nr:MAG: winged helix-turn-helix transcriptional regulator [Candidatus Bathyarchaeota archaeon]
MSEELKKEMKRLKEELADLKEELKDEKKEQRGIYIDIGNVAEAVEGIAESIQGELERSIFIGPHGSHVKIRRPGIKIHKRGEKFEEEDRHVDFNKVAAVMSALGQEHRLRILGELMRGGKYPNELQENLPEIAASTLSSHLSVLEEQGLIIQERVRGRYLITIPGRSAYKMARRITKSLERRHSE